MFTLERFAQETVLYDVGDEPTHVYLVSSGELQLRYSDSFNQIMFPGSFVGGLEVVCQESRGCRLIAARDSAVFVLDASLISHGRVWLEFLKGIVAVDCTRYWDLVKNYQDY